MNEFPDEFLPSKIFNSKKAPILWIGSGISKRYVKGFKTWEELLKSAASKAGIEEDQFIARLNIVRNDLGATVSDEDVYSAFALDLSNIINDKIAEGELTPANLFDDNLLNQYRHKVDPLKLLVCSDLQNIDFKEEYNEEIQLFKRLSESTPAVITTNYDLVIETLFDNKFKVYSNTDEYYFSDSIGLGEIYKIHGTIKRPSSIVLNENDYELLSKNSFVITSKIVTLLCESPLVILGYSMGDKLIRNMIGKLFVSFSKEKQTELAKNILYIDYSPNSEPKKGTMQIQSESGMLYINTLTIDNFVPLLKDLSDASSTIPITQLRKIKQMVRNVISAEPTKNKRIAYVGIEGIDDVDQERTVIAFTTSAAIQDIKTIQRYETIDLLIDVLEKQTISASSLVDRWFEENKSDKVAFIPIFHYLRKLNRDPEAYSSKMKSYIEYKSNQYDAFKNKPHTKMIDSVSDVNSFQHIMDSEKIVGKREDLILLAYMKDLINESEATRYIKEILEKEGKTKLNETTMRRAITYLAFKNLKM